MLNEKIENRRKAGINKDTMVAVATAVVAKCERATEMELELERRTAETCWSGDGYGGEDSRTQNEKRKSVP